MCIYSRYIEHGFTVIGRARIASNMQGCGEKDGIIQYSNGDCFMVSAEKGV
jgi:hypothetical protein